MEQCCELACSILILYVRYGEFRIRSVIFGGNFTRISRNIRLLGHANTAKVSSGGGHRDRLDRGALDITALLESPLRHLSLPACSSTNPYWATYPPSTVIVCPVTNEAASAQSHTTASAISSRRPILPTGRWATIY